MPFVDVHTRWDDCDRYGHVNNAAYLALLREATEQVLIDTTLRRPAEVAIEYKLPVPPGASVAVGVEADPASDGLLIVRYTVLLKGSLRATAQVAWRTSDEAEAIALPPPPQELAARPFQWRHRVRTYEVGPDDDVRPTVVLQWLEHAVFRAAERIGWGIERMREADFVTLQIGHHLVLDATAMAGDELAISSRLVEMRRVSGTWHHEVRHTDGRLVAADRSRGAFLDLAGRVRQAPAEMIAALLLGEP